MRRNEYLEIALDLYNNDKISEDAYDAMVENADVFCDDSEYRGSYGLPSTYTEIEYDDFDNAEAVDGARFDDMNYLRYTEQ